MSTKLEMDMAYEESPPIKLYVLEGRVLRSSYLVILILQYIRLFWLFYVAINIPFNTESCNNSIDTYYIHGY